MQRHPLFPGLISASAREEEKCLHFSLDTIGEHRYYSSRRSSMLKNLDKLWWRNWSDDLPSLQTSDPNHSTKLICSVGSPEWTTFDSHFLTFPEFKYLWSGHCHVSSSTTIIWFAKILIEFSNSFFFYHYSPIWRHNRVDICCCSSSPMFESVKRKVFVNICPRSGESSDRFHLCRTAREETRCRSMWLNLVQVGQFFVRLCHFLMFLLWIYWRRISSFLFSLVLIDIRRLDFLLPLRSHFASALVMLGSSCTRAYRCFSGRSACAFVPAAARSSCFECSDVWWSDAHTRRTASTWSHQNAFHRSEHSIYRFIVDWWLSFFPFFRSKMNEDDDDEDYDQGEWNSPSSSFRNGWKREEINNLSRYWWILIIGRILERASVCGTIPWQNKLSFSLEHGHLSEAAHIRSNPCRWIDGREEKRGEKRREEFELIQSQHFQREEKSDDVRAIRTV